MKRNYDDEDFIPWYRRVTPTWLGLSIEARGALVSIAMHLNRQTGELPLRKGLSSLAVLLNIPWEKLEPAVAELVAEEKLGWDGSRFVLFDPEHENRRRRTSADRMRDLRAKAKASESQPPSGNVTPSDACDVRDEHKTDVTGVTPVLSVSSVSSDLISSSEADQINLTGGSSADPPPKWFADVVSSVETSCVVDLRVPDCWLRYAGHRAEKGKKPSANDARYWLTTVMVPEAREEAKQAHRQRERDARFKDHTPKYEKPTAGQTSAFQAELQRRLAEEAKKGAA